MQGLSNEIMCIRVAQWATKLPKVGGLKKDEKHAGPIKPIIVNYKGPP